HPMLLEVGVPALFMGFAFPLANALIQRAEQSVGRRAGMLYLANTVGAVAGSLVAGFVLLPRFGLHTSTTALMFVAAATLIPLYMAVQASGSRLRTTVGAGSRESVAGSRIGLGAA